MRDLTGVIPFGPHGPAETGLADWEEIDSAGLVSGTPLQRGHIYHQESGRGYLSGIWDCTAFTSKCAPYPDDELMILLEGELTLKTPDGAETRLKAGDAFVIPKGLECQWIQPGYLRKVFMILSEPIAEETANPSLNRITVPDLSLPSDPDGVIDACQTWFVNSTGRMVVATRQCAGRRSAEEVTQGNDLMHIIAGSVTTIIDGNETTFGPGDTFYVVQGTRLIWRTAPGTWLLQTRYVA
ncbi:MAG: cupin domain-containing protein [Pseudomonadota bacterium]